MLNINNNINLFIKSFQNKIPLLLLKLEEPKGHKSRIIAILFTANVGIALEAISAFITKRESKALYKALLAMREQQNFK